MLRSFRLAVAAGLLACSVTLTCGRAACQDETPPIFDKRVYAEAKAAAAADQKWFIVKATATWCAPCKKMDKTTWRDEKVVQWLTEHAIVVALDVDDHGERAQQLGIEAMPTMVAFAKGDQEFDRVVGYQAPSDLLAWLEGIAKGEKSIVALRKRAGDRDATTDDIDVSARLDLARSLAQARQVEEAAAEYAWLWQHMLEHDQAMYGVRLSFMASEMQQLAARDPGAKQRFVELRDRTTELIEGETVAEDDIADWVTLNKIVGDTARTLTWFDKVKDASRYRPLVARVSRDLQELLVAAKRWADLGRVHPDPVGDLEQQHELLAMMAADTGQMDQETRSRVLAISANQLREKAGPVYGGLLAAARPEAARFAARARELDGSPEMLAALVTGALEAGQPRPEHVQWLAAAEDGTEHARVISDLRARTEAALEKAKAK